MKSTLNIEDRTIAELATAFFATTTRLVMVDPAKSDKVWEECKAAAIWIVEHIGAERA